MTGLGPVGKERFHAAIGQWVFNQFPNHPWWGCHHVGADARAFGDVIDRTNRGRENLGLEVVIVVDEADVADQFETVECDVVEPADERRNEAGSGLGCQERLVGRKTQGHVDLAAILGKRLARLQPVPGHWNLDRDVVGDLG